MCGNVNSDTRRISDSSITTAAFLPSHSIACGMVAEFSGGGVTLVSVDDRIVMPEEMRQHVLFVPAQSIEMDFDVRL